MMTKKVYDFGFTPAKAKLLTVRKGNKGYCVVEDRDGVQWLVYAVVDNGRQMLTYKAGTDGKVEKYIGASDYKDYIIITDETDVAE